MKKFTHLPFVLLASLLAHTNLSAQNPTVSVTTNVCFNSSSPGSNTCQAIVTGTTSGANNYQWVVVAVPGNSVFGSYSQLSGTTGTNVALSFPACGSYSVACLAYNGSSNLNIVTSTSVYVVCPNWLSVSNSGICAGSSQTIVANPSGATGFSWTNGTSIISTSSSAVVSPTANTCYTVTATYPGSSCSSSAVACVSVVTTPTISLNVIQSNSVYCIGEPIVINANGGNSYNCGSLDGYWVVNGSSITVWPNASNSCFTVTGYNLGCYSSTVICFTTQTGPTLTLSASPSATVCPGTPVTIGALGGVNYTWTTNTTWPYPVISNSATAIVTPTNPSSWNSYTVVATNSLGCTTTTYIVVNINISPAILTNTNSLCPGESRTLTMNFPGTYVWTNGSSTLTGNSIVVSPTVSTCYSVTGISSSSCIVNLSTCLIVTNNVPINISVSSINQFNPFIACSNYGIHLSPWGAATYTWQPGNVVSGNNWFYPTANTCYTVTGTTIGGCTGTAVQCVTVASSPTIQVSGNNTVCLGSAINLTASGIANYAWWTINGSSTVAPVSFTPSSAGQYTWMVSGTNNAGCWDVVNGTSTVFPNPAINISGNNNICLGTSVNLTAGGGNTYTWSTGATGASIVSTPNANTCYSVMGTSLNGCNGMAVSCITVQPATLTSSPLSQTICLGSSANLNASGAITYTWNNGAAASTLNVLPVVSTNYSVSGTYSNGCIGVNVLSVVVNTACSDVWPGDANSDGIVNNTDVFEIGLAYNNTGSPRNPGGNSYVSQYATNWAGTVSTGKNKCHADCNGDGVVNNSDTLAIYNNYLLTHAFKPSGSSSTNPDIYISSDVLSADAGVWNKADILLGNSSNQLNQIYGVAFDIEFDKNLIESNSAYILYSPSILNASNQNVEFKKLAFSNGKIYAASVRTDGNEVNGYGKIGELWFKVKTGLPDNTDINLGILTAKKTDKTGVIKNLNVAGIVLSVNNNVTALKEVNTDKNQIGFFPNPATDQIVLRSLIASQIYYSIYDVTGREILKGEFTNSTTVNLTTYSAGTYLICFKNGSSTTYKKLVLEK